MHAEKLTVTDIDSIPLPKAVAGESCDLHFSPSKGIIEGAVRVSSKLSVHESTVDHLGYIYVHASHQR